MELPTDMSSCSSAVPQALEEMMASHTSILQISQYCKDAYQQTGDVSPELYNQTKQYTNDAVLNVAFHIHRVGLHLTNFLAVQASEMEKLDLQIRTLSDRFKAVHDQTGTLTLRTMESLRNSQRDVKIRTLDPAEAGELGCPMPPYQRPSLNFE